MIEYADDALILPIFTEYQVRIVCSAGCHTWDLPVGWMVTLLDIVDPHGEKVEIGYPVTVDTRTSV